MKSYNIYNFDHGFSSETSFETDSFKIIINEQHCLNLKKLEKNASTTFTHDNNAIPIIVENESQEGSFEITAIIEIEDSDYRKSYLYPKELNSKYINDITLVLSFLTGRKIYLEDEISRHSTKFYIDGPITINLLSFRQIRAGPS